MAALATPRKLLTERDARHRPQQRASHTRELVGGERDATAMVRERERGVAELARNLDRIARPRAAAQQRRPAGTSPRIVTHRLSGPRVVSPPTRSTP